MPSPPSEKKDELHNVRSQSPARRQSPARGGVRSQSPSARRTGRSQSPAPMRDQSPARRTSRSQSPAPTKRDQSPGSSRVRSQSPARRPDMSVQESFSSLQSSLQGLDLESTPDDLSLGYSVDESKSRPSITKASSARSDDLSLSYSVEDDKSRASTYISAVSEDESGASRTSSHRSASRKQRFEPEPIPEDAPAQQTDQPSMLGQFLSSPLEYVFGGNGDDVSTLGEFNDYNSWDGDNSTIATTTTLKRELSMQHQPTIYEDDEEEEEEGEGQQFQGSQENGDYDEEEEDDGSGYGEVSEASESQEDDKLHQDKFSETLKSRGEVHESSRLGHSGQRETYDPPDESEYTYVNDEDMSVAEQTYAGDISAITEDPYFRQANQEAKRVARMEKLEEDVEEMEEEEYECDEEPSSAQDMQYNKSENQQYFGHQSAKSLGSAYSEDTSSIYSGASPNFLTEKSRFNVTDEDAARTRSNKQYDDDKSISLSTAMESESVSEPRKKDPNESERSMSTSSKQASYWSSSEANNSIRSEAWQRDMHSNRTWRSAKIQNSQRSSRKMGGSSFRRPFLSSQSVGQQSVGSFRTAMTTMPEVPEVIREGDNGHPTMTRGMSGRAVIHVKMDHTNDGTIEELSYTAPLVDCDQSDSATYISYGDESYSIRRSDVPLFDDYFRRYKIVRMFMGKRCHRIMALIALVVSIALAVLVSLVAQVNELDKTSLSSTSLAAPVSLDDLVQPVSFTSVRFPTYLKSHIHDWFDKNGDYKRRSNDVPFYVDIPKSGPEIVARSWGGCLGLTLARDQGREVDSTLRTEKIQGIEYVVTDLSTKHGVEHAASLNIVSSGVPDVIISPLFHDVVDSLYSSGHKAKLIISMREPVRRSLAMYNYMKTVHAEVSEMTIEAFAQSKYIENNYVTRLLSGKKSGKITQKEVEYCKELLRRKAVVGTYEDIEVALKHFEQYLGWLSPNSNVLNCQANIISNDINKDGSMDIDESSSAYSLLRQQNMHDLALYGYVRNVLVPYQHEVIKRQRQALAGSTYTIKQ
eukprot:CAMPEP_0194202312 /NCGR_PEP_ID=MMETSP0156-20130528/2373_1 /TAXON_ID=33649 /ORGANISM="Thalassionema nitzschioides, Strain L26-B" /LENGTH=1035 /DNA_ID=CAMNT_0038927775 /DNA_START=15 /DNA_END=3122 /DNA_ORIENTATION=-